MSTKRRNIIASVLLAVYSLALALVCSEGYSQYTPGLSLHKQGTENYQSIITGDQPGGALLANKPVTADFNNAHFSTKKSISESAAVQKSIDQQLASSYAQYYFTAITIAIRQRITESLFPFHYFW